jgi:hypothetical protein
MMTTVLSCFLGTSVKSIFDIFEIYIIGVCFYYTVNPRMLRQAYNSDRTHLSHDNFRVEPGSTQIDRTCSILS